MTSLTHFLLIVGIDIITITLFAYGIYYLKYKQTEGLVSYLLFNVFIFLIIYFLGHSEVSMTVGFAIFGLVGLVRLRSDTFSRVDITYFIGSLTIAIINALGSQTELGLLISVNLIILIITLLIDHILFGRSTYETLSYTLDEIPPSILSNKQVGCTLLGKQLNVEVVDYTISNINTLKDSVKMVVTYRN